MSDMDLPPYQNRGPSVLAVAWTTIAVAFITTVARFLARFKLRAFGLDDALIVVALAISILGGTANILMVKHGFGKHIEYISPPDQIEMARWSYVAVLQACPGPTLTKLSIAWFLLRMVSGVSGTYRVIRIAIYIDMAVLIIVMVIFMVADLLSCRPLEASFNPAVKGECISKTSLGQFAAAVNIVNVLTDFFCVIVPLFILRTLQMNRRSKMAIAVILTLGLLTASCSIGRAATVNYNVSDPSWDFVDETIWVIMEQNVGIVVANLPACRQLFSFFSRTMSTRRTEGTTGDDSWMSRSRSRYAKYLSGRGSRGSKAFNTINSQDNDPITGNVEHEAFELDSQKRIHVQTDISLETSRRTYSETDHEELGLGPLKLGPESCIM